MVDVPNDLGVPSVAPETRAPDDYQQVEPKAGAALNQLGQSSVDLSKVFGQVQTDNVTATALQQAQGVLDNYSQTGSSRLHLADPEKNSCNSYMSQHSCRSDTPR